MVGGAEAVSHRAKKGGRGVCWGGRPPTASMCQNEVAKISDKGAVHERYYPNWCGHVQECFPAAWRGCGRAAGAAQEAAPARFFELFRATAADQGRLGSLRRGGLLGARGGGAGGPAEAAAGAARGD